MEVFLLFIVYIRENYFLCTIEKINENIQKRKKDGKLRKKGIRIKKKYKDKEKKNYRMKKKS